MMQLSFRICKISNIRFTNCFWNIFVRHLLDAYPPMVTVPTASIIGVGFYHVIVVLGPPVPGATDGAEQLLLILCSKTSCFHPEDKITDLATSRRKSVPLHVLYSKKTVARIIQFLKILPLSHLLRLLRCLYFSFAAKST